MEHKNGGQSDAIDPFTIQEVLSLRALKRLYLDWVLQHCEGNRAEAARLMVIDRSTLYRLLETNLHGLPRAPLDEPRAPLDEPSAERAE